MNNPCDYSEILTAVIGVGGTLAGTILGWILNGVSQRGSLKVFLFSWGDSFEYNLKGYMVPSTSKEQTESYHFNGVLDIYNSSRDTKIMRNISIVFSDGKNDLKIFTPKDDATRYSIGHLTQYLNVSPINIPPQSVKQVKLLDGIWKDKSESLNFIWDTKKVHLTYSNSKGKRKRVLLHTESYCDRFKDQKVEEQ